MLARVRLWMHSVEAFATLASTHTPQLPVPAVLINAPAVDLGSEAAAPLAGALLLLGPFNDVPSDLMPVPTLHLGNRTAPLFSLANASAQARACTLLACRAVLSPPSSIAEWGADAGVLGPPQGGPSAIAPHAARLRNVCMKCVQVFITRLALDGLAALPLPPSASLPELVSTDAALVAPQPSALPLFGLAGPNPTTPSGGGGALGGGGGGDATVLPAQLVEGAGGGGSDTAAVQLHNVTLVVPVLDYLALLTLATDETLLSVRGCMDAQVRAVEGFGSWRSCRLDVLGTGPRWRGQGGPQQRCCLMRGGVRDHVPPSCCTSLRLWSSTGRDVQ